MFDSVFTLDAAFVSMAVGLVVSFLLFWAPGLAPWWAQVTVKRISLIGLFLGIPVLVTLAGCYLTLPLHIAVACSPEADPTTAFLANLWDALKIGFTGLVASAGGFQALMNWAPDLMNDAHKVFVNKTGGSIKFPNLIDLDPDFKDWLGGSGTPAVASVWDPAAGEPPISTTAQADTRPDTG